MDDLTVWIKKLGNGDPRAEQVIWDNFFSRLVRLAKQRLRHLPVGADDEEDIALSALGSFYKGLADHKFPRLDSRDDLWKLLATLTIRKTIAHRRRGKALKRGGKHELRDSRGPRPDDQWEFELADPAPSPEFVVVMTETFNAMLSGLEDEVLRTIAVQKLEGYSNEEIAGGLGCAVRTVERKLARIRQLLEFHGQERPSASARARE
ncbi:MAG: ECF-type sigma factor [Pirellulaceae bacterium]